MNLNLVKPSTQNTLRQEVIVQPLYRKPLPSLETWIECHIWIQKINLKRKIVCFLLSLILIQDFLILSLDSELCKVINPNNIFASYRGTKTIKDLLVHSKLSWLQEEEDLANEIPESYKQGICQPCKKQCILCKKIFIENRICLYQY